jgi:exodeoxyribonuclease VII large subunit
MMQHDTADLPFVQNRKVYSVSALNHEARAVIETHLGTVWVEGEISNLARPSSGHMYWSLKDEHAQIRCAMFRQYGRHLGFAPANGQQVLVRGRVSVYEARGDYQLVVDYMEDAGEGLLRRKFEQLKAKLAAEGLFDESRKRPIPHLPSRIGVITSPTGAAIHDILTALRRRFPAIPVLIYPSAVQGDGAAKSLAAALDLANRRMDCDVLLLARGGGSLEDLWAFNEEVLARAVAASLIPVISGIGHETDFTIADFVADLRAPTPSQAAELAVPDQGEWRARVARAANQLARETRHRVALEARRLERLTHRLERQHPGVALRESAQRLDDAEARLRDFFSQLLLTRTRALQDLELRLGRHDPVGRVALMRAELARVAGRLAPAMNRTIDAARNRLAVAGAALQTLSPLATLERGYAIVTSEKNVVTNAASLAVGEWLELRFAHGSAAATVVATRTADDEGAA